MKAKRMVIIGGGIAGLCTAVYARKCGYTVEVFEMGTQRGGLATSWRRLSDVSIEDYGKRFRNPLLRSFFSEGAMAEMSALALVFSLA